LALISDKNHFEFGLLLANAFSTKNKHLLAIYAIPTRGFTAAVSVFGGTPPAKPLICKSKIRLARPSGAIFRLWADSTGEASLLVLANFNLPPKDITWMSLCFRSQIIRVSLLSIHSVVLAGKTKTLLTRGKQGEEILSRFVTCLHQAYPDYLRASARLAPRIVQG
jgi:hypothetical protein